LNERVEGLVEVRDCPHGKGVFALRDFLQGESIALVIGGDFTHETISKGHALRIGEELYWDEAPEDAPGFWSNFLDHSSQPNCRFVDFDRSLPGATLIATRRVGKGEELFLDYAEYYPDNPTF
jgi:hypothetical protein